jgi:hypothetical protein
MKELDQKNSLDRGARAKVAAFAKNQIAVTITATARRDAALLRLNKIGILDSISCHLDGGGPLFFERLDSGEAAYLIPECGTEAGDIYVKVKFYIFKGTEMMLILSAHPNRRW